MKKSICRRRKRPAIFFSKTLITANISASSDATDGIQAASAEHLLISIDRGWDISKDNLREKSSLIIEQADRMSHIIDHVRLFAREAGKHEMRLVQVNDIVNSAVGMLSTQFDSKGIILESHLCKLDCTILANPFSLEEVILNLMQNARDAVESQIAKKDDKVYPKIILRTKLIKKKFVKVEVIDNGIGIQKDVLPKVFDPFFTTKDPDKGTGLGLAISKSIVEQFNGTLHIKSSIPNGTNASIIIPLANK